MDTTPQDTEPDNNSPDDIETAHSEIPSPTLPSKTGVGLGTVLAFSILSAFAGSAGGFGLAKHFLTSGSGVDQSALDSKFTDVSNQLKTVQTNTDRLEGSVKSLLSDSSDSSSLDLSELTARLDDLETQMAAKIDAQSNDTSNQIEDATPESEKETEAKDVETIDTETPQENDEPAEVLPSPDIAKLTEDIQALKDRLASVETIDIPDFDLTPIETRVLDLENQIASLSDATSKQFSQSAKRLVQVEAQVQDIKSNPPKQLLPPFPREAVLSAMTENQQADGNWVSRTLGKHVTIQDEAAIATLDEIDGFITSGDIDAALVKVKSLPESAQMAADAWINAAQP